MQNRYGSKTRFFKETSFLLITFWNLFWFPSTWFKVGSHAGNFFIILGKRSSKHSVEKWIKFYFACMDILIHYFESTVDYLIDYLPPDWKGHFFIVTDAFVLPTVWTIPYSPICESLFLGQTRWKCDRVMNPIFDPLFG